MNRSHRLKLPPRSFVATIVGVLQAGLVAAGCREPSPAPAQQAATTTASPSATSAFIVADPNPVPTGHGVGTTMIRWSTGTGQVGQVYVEATGEPDKLFAEGTEGAVPAKWIATGKGFQFRLYEGRAKSRLIASVNVTRR
jgi:hypothetical protein